MAASGIPSSKSERLAGKVAIITGGASGIGETTVKLFVEHGAKVIIADIQDEKGQNLARQLGPAAVYTHCDVRSESSVAATVALAVERFGKLDIMFSNAGITPKDKKANVTEMEMADFDEVMAVNVRGAALGAKYAGKAMMERGGGGVILLTASVASVMSPGGLAAYTVSKHAVLGVMRSSAGDLGKYGIRVNCISPAGIATPMGVEYCREVLEEPSLSAAETQAFIDKSANLQGRSISSMDIANCALFLASDEAAYISGLNLLVDGGFTITRP